MIECLPCHPAKQKHAVKENEKTTSCILHLPAAFCTYSPPPTLSPLTASTTLVPNTGGTFSSSKEHKFLEEC